MILTCTLGIEASLSYIMDVRVHDLERRKYPKKYRKLIELVRAMIDGASSQRELRAEAKGLTEELCDKSVHTTTNCTLILIPQYS